MQLNEQMSMKPSVARKLADRIKQLEDELEVTRDASRVKDLERKVQVCGGAMFGEGVAGCMCTSSRQHMHAYVGLRMCVCVGGVRLVSGCVHA